MVIILMVSFIVLVGVSIVRGAPYVPTHKSQLSLALDMLDLKPGDHIVDVGSGDGSLLHEAAKRGYKCTGYEINPILCVVSWYRLRKYRETSKIVWTDMWKKKLPKDTKAIFVFTMGWYMPRLVRKIKSEGLSNVLVASHAYAIQGLEPVKKEQAILLYKI